MAQTKGEHKQELLDCFEILSISTYRISIIFAGSRRGCPAPHWLPNHHGHPSQSGSMDHVPRRSPVWSGEQTLLDVQPAQKHGTLKIPCRTGSQVCSPEGLWGEKEEKFQCYIVSVIIVKSGILLSFTGSSETPKTTPKESVWTKISEGKSTEWCAFLSSH